MNDENYISDEQLNQILVDYQKQQTIETMTGPAISFVMHIVMLILCITFILTNTKSPEPPIVAKTIVLEEIVLDKEIEDEVIEIEQEITEDDLFSETLEAPKEEIVSEDSSPEDINDAPAETADDSDMQDVLDIVNNNSICHFPSTMGGRNPNGRKRGVRDGGGSIRGQASVVGALRWLASVQNQNGSWGEGKGFSVDSGHPGHTGLALLVFLAHGETPLSEKYGTHVQKAMRWLSNYGNQSDLNVKRRPMGYAHGIATYAISEAYAMTKIPFMQTAMENCIDKIIEGQMGNGGFGYGYTSGSRWDISVAGWNIQALKAARMAGCHNEKLSSSIKKSVSFLKTTSYNGSGNFAYAGDKKQSRPNMGGIGTLCLQLLGEGNSKQVQEGYQRIIKTRLEEYQKVMKDPSKWKSIGSHSLYGWYYDTQVVYNMKNKNRKQWKEWRKAFETVLIKSQHNEGYWETTGHGTGANTSGRVLSTCWAALQLEVYYRYLPSFDSSKFETITEDDLIIEL